MHDHRDLERFYDAVADEFDADYYGDAADPYLRTDVDAFERILLDVIAARHPTRALEIGCGTGHWLAWLDGRGIPATGIDVSRRMCEVAQARGFDARQADASDLPYRDAEFDLVIAPYCALDHCERYTQAFAELDRVAASDATLVLMVDNSDRVISRYWEVTHKRVRSVGGDPRAGQWNHQVDGQTVSVFTKMFSRHEIETLLPGWHGRFFGIGLLLPLIAKVTRPMLPRSANERIVRALAPVESIACRVAGGRSALTVYVGQRSVRD